MNARRKRNALVIGGLSVLAEAVAAGVRRGSFLRVDTIVRCRWGHLFTTYWVPGVSLKALRLGWWRWQRCPVGRHWSMVTPVRPSSLSESERQEALRAHDLRIP